MSGGPTGGGIAPRRLVLATRNPSKRREIAAIYAHLPLTLVSLADYPEIGDLPEEGTTYAENASAKARPVATATGMVALADDSGIEIAALGGAPGIHSARFLGEGATSAERNARVLTLLQNVPAGRRTAWYRAVIAVALPDGVVRVFEGACAGAIAEAARGTGGFGYDPIFVPEGQTGTMAEIPPDTKNRISHRARALRAAEPFLLKIFGLAVQDRVDAGGT